MTNFEYRVVAAPNRGVKAKGIKSNEARFAHALEEMMNSMAEEGWEYQRAETLPSIERSGLTSTTTTWRNVLVFRRPLAAEAARDDIEATAVAAAETVHDSATEDALEHAVHESTEPRQDPPVTTPQSPDEDASQSAGASRMLRDNGVEELSEVSGVSTSLKQLAKNRNTSETET